ncbi:hypothetical protein QJS04_geneDACA017121 [Acorus gramineus]|uniref:B box-type domain-containing protein n=1 Tax=Acorus gramineus TaxID=55184 RepID=A0AAV9AXK0_ACOGR|nr:hypothetical protein QJS04_geneDACA017121 [Acorus gramineus]
MNRKRKLSDSSRESGDKEESCLEWLSKLLKEEDFFKECERHLSSKMNCFCLDCCIPFCTSCNHKLHKSIKEYKQGNKNLEHITSSKIQVSIEYTNHCLNINCRRKLLAKASSDLKGRRGRQGDYSNWWNIVSHPLRTSSSIGEAVTGKQWRYPTGLLVSKPLHPT